MAATQTTNNNSIRSILEKEKLNGSNFLDWYRNLRIVLRNEQKLHHLEEALPEAPPATAIAAVRNAYTCKVAEQQEVACLMLPFHACKQEEGQSISTYVLKMKAYLDQMEHLGYPMPLGKQRGKGKNKLAYDPKHKIPPPGKKEHLAKDTECHHCHKTGHWKKNCPLYLAELKKNKASASGTSGIFTIELFSFPKSNTWIYDTGYGNHICNTIQGFRRYQKLNKGALDLYVGNGHSASIEAIRSFKLILPSGMILVLDNCHFPPSITRGIVSLSRLCDKGFRHEFMDNCAISDRRGEYLSQEFLDHLRSHRIISQFTPPYTPQHNGVSERRNRTLLDMVRSMRSLTTLPMSFWGYALESTVRILNMVPIKKGCEALVKRDTPNKLESRSIKCIFVGYPKEIIGYYFYYPLENKIFVARYAEFFETKLIKQEASGSTVDFDEIQSENAQPSENTSLHQHEVEPDTVEPQTDVNPIRRSTRISQAPERYGC
ncbi:retrotransposon protein, putative, ty1-copia subclass [Tanacetum coccineum]|uniref:Retrotransposon protein, putative, ty1-copia subclass n=1 Tax=Tanacetum coccineum TaxID=301880 RepID=A0ABQ4WLF2_9ASTR